MPLIDRNGTRDETFSREGAGTATPLVAFEALEAAFASHNAALGVEIANNQALEPLIPHFERLALIAIRFPAFNDGRGFTLARKLRRAGFTGTLRAAGPLIADQFAYALACGFDEIELPEALAERQPVAQWQAALAARPVSYQRGYETGTNILEARRAARAEGNTGGSHA
jgi:uncharacterized protein (DUF934 family)